MKIDHIAIWTNELEKMRDFYCKFFGGTSSEKYINAKKGFESYFIAFSEGARLEIMKRTDIARSPFHGEEFIGINHLAFNAGSKKKVDTLTESLRVSGYSIAGEPRTTGDGYYESVVLDPEGNKVEVVG